MITHEGLRQLLKGVLFDKMQQGHDTENLYEELKAIPKSYDALFTFGDRLTNLPFRKDWQFVEPSSLEEIWRECDPSRPMGAIAQIDLAEAKKRVETAFYGSVCGCILGKPLEEAPYPDLYEIRKALESVGKWPMNDYVSEDILEAMGRRNISWTETTKGKISFVAQDDDITYTIMGMLLLEKYGTAFTKDHIRQLWIENLPIYTTWGPERAMLLRAGISSIAYDEADKVENWASFLNPGDEFCGALIRADAYGYACPGRPALAAELAWKDASWTHRRTGIYGAMFIAAVIASAQVVKDPLEIFNIGLKYVPQKSRFYKIVSDSLNEVSKAKDWVDGYGRIHAKYEEYSACRVYQEVGTVINTLRFAENVADGICKQVSQGNDTDSFGATAGSILGAYFGPDHFDTKWLEPFNDDIYTTINGFMERRLSKVAERMTTLPELILKELEN